jgi:hypothetical protein
MTRVVNLAYLQLGDTLLQNRVPYIVSNIQADKYCYELQLTDSTGTKINKCIPADEQVIIEL